MDDPSPTLVPANSPPQLLQDIKGSPNPSLLMPTPLIGAINTPGLGAMAHTPGLGAMTPGLTAMPAGGLTYSLSGTPHQNNRLSTPKFGFTSLTPSMLPTTLPSSFSHPRSPLMPSIHGRAFGNIVPRQLGSYSSGSAPVLAVRDIILGRSRAGSIVVGAADAENMDHSLSDNDVSSETDADDDESLSVPLTRLTTHKSPLDTSSIYDFPSMKSAECR